MESLIIVYILLTAVLETNYDPRVKKSFKYTHKNMKIKPDLYNCFEIIRSKVPSFTVPVP